MKIKRFYESDQVDISSERVDDILKSLKEFTFKLEDENKKIDALTTELSSYKNVSTKSNDQIDDSIAALQIVVKNVNDTIDKLDTVISNLDDYNMSGRSYLYTENK
jgi:ABC-type transporter Mla subunit MlaD